MPRKVFSDSRVIGLTGAPGAGKSEALRLLASLGVPTLQTDLLGHKILRGKKFKNQLVKIFGKTILGNRGEIDRLKLGAVAFKNHLAQTRLNKLIHPEIRRRVSLWVDDQLNKSYPSLIMAVEVPLIFESGYNLWFDGVLCISSRTVNRLSRLTKRGWSLSEAHRRESLQWPIKKRELHSDWVVRNNGTRKEFRNLLVKWLNKMIGPKTIRNLKHFRKT